MAKRHIIGNLPSGDILCRCDDGNTYENCGTQCECCNQFEGVTTPVTGWSNRVVNPASKGGFGFNKSYDGRIRGGIITPEFYTSPKPIRNRSFNKFI